MNNAARMPPQQGVINTAAPNTATVSSSDDILVHSNMHTETMRVTHDEAARARAIQAAAEHLKPLTDMGYAQYAIAASPDESISQIIHRMTVMQEFKDDYLIHDTVEEGVELMTQLTLRHPGLLLALEYLPSSRNYLTVADLVALDPQRIVRSKEDERVFLGGLYYACQCQAAQLEAIRNGTSCVVECMGLGPLNLDLPLLDKIVHKFYRWYPRLQKEQCFVNAPQGDISTLFGLYQRVLSKNQNETQTVVHTIPGLEGVRIDALYKTPSEEEARRHVLKRVQQYLTLRYHNERKSRLPAALKKEYA